VFITSTTRDLLPVEEIAPKWAVLAARRSKPASANTWPSISVPKV
jgi:hypothetical protein